MAARGPFFLGCAAPIAVWFLCLLSFQSVLAKQKQPFWSLDPMNQFVALISRRSLAEAGTSRGVDWRPQEGKYLLALCLQGSMSDQLRCLKKTFKLAGILNRTLLVSPPAVAFVSEQQQPLWDWTTVVNFARMRTCLDNITIHNSVYTVPEYLKNTNEPKLKVDKIICAVPGTPTTTGCYHTKLANAFQEASKGTVELPHPDETTLHMSPLTVGRRQLQQQQQQQPGQGQASIADISKAFGSLPDKILCLGDVSELDFEEPGGVLSNWTMDTEECTNLWRAHPAVQSFVDGILDTLLGDQFAALHWKRGPQVPVTDVATRVRTKFNGTEVPVLYVATDARKAELDTLGTLMKDHNTHGKRFAALLTLRDLLVDEDWLLHQFWSQKAILMEKEQKNGVALALVDKFVCARARYFLGTEKSKFTRDILDMRKDEGWKNPEGMGDYF